MDTVSVKRWIREKILKTGFDGTCGVASFSEVYNDLMPIQQKEVEKLCGDDFNLFLSSGSTISIAVFHTENAIKSINAFKDGRVDHEKWNIYANEYDSINNVLNDVCAKLISVLDGVPLRATSGLDRKPRLVEEYYPFAKLSHRVVAEHAGVGARGKNELIVTKQNGSALRLTSFITPRKLDQDKKMNDLCGDCKACLNSCRILQKKDVLQNYRQQCMQKIHALTLKYDVCGVCMQACYENGNWRKIT